MDDITQAWAGEITKSEKTADGHLMVYGTASSPAVDLDEQIADPAWLKTAMPDWMRWANVREMHGPVAAGVGRELSEDGEKWQLKALVVDRNVAEKVEAKVYKGFSIGIKNPQVVRDKTARGGRIVGGTIIEVSLVDRPCNPEAVMGIAKVHGGVLAPVEVAGEVVGSTVGKSAEDGPADTGSARPEPTEDDLLLADAAASATKAAAMEDLPIFADVARGAATGPYGGAVGATAGAREAGAVHADGSPVLAPSAWRRAVATTEAVLAGTLVKRKADESADIAGAQAIIGQLADLIISEATELKAGRCEEADDIACLMDAVRAVKVFMWREQRQDGQDFPDPTAVPSPPMAYVGLGAGTDLDKKYIPQDERDEAADSGAAMPDGRYPIRDEDELKAAIHLAGNGSGSKAAIRAHIIRRARALGLGAMIPDDWSAKVAEPDGVKAVVGPDIAKMIDDAVAEANSAARERIAALEADLAKVKATPVPGGPFIMPAPAQRPAAADDPARRAAEYSAQARRASDPAVAHAYAMAAQQAGRHPTE